MNGRTIFALLGIVAAALLTGCGPVQKQVVIDSYIWPLESANPKLKALRVFSNSDEFVAESKEKGVLMKELVGDVQTDWVDSKSTRIATDGKGVIYIAVPRVKMVQVVDFRTQKMDKIPFTGVFPSAIAATEDGRIFVGNRDGGNVVEIDRKGRFIWSYGKLLADEDVEKWEKDNKSTTGRFNDIADIYLHDGKLYIADHRLGKIEVVTMSGQYITTLTGVSSPTAVMVDKKNGDIYALSRIVGKMFVFTQDGKPKGEMFQPGDNVWAMNFPNGVDMDSEGNIYVIDSGSHGLKIYNHSGEFLYYMGAEKAAPFLGNYNAPKDVVVDAQDRIYVLDSFNMRLVVLEYLGQKYRESNQNMASPEPMLRR